VNARLNWRYQNHTSTPPQMLSKLNGRTATRPLSPGFAVGSRISGRFRGSEPVVWASHRASMLSKLRIPKS
jgi:hypothetical protein